MAACFETFCGTRSVNQLVEILPTHCEIKKSLTNRSHCQTEVTVSYGRQYLEAMPLDQQLKYLQSIGVGAVKKQAPVIIHEVLCERKVIGINTSQSLLNAIFFLNEKNLILRGVSEQLNLRIGQISLLANSERIQCGSKNNAGDIAEQNFTVKNVTINSVPASTHMPYQDLP